MTIYYMHFRKLLTSVPFYLSIVIIIGSSCFTLSRNITLYGLNNYNDIGFLNLFIYSTIKGNTILPIFAPVIASLSYGISFFDELKTGFARNIAILISPKKYFISRIVFSGFAGGFSMFVGLIIVFLGCLIIEPCDSTMMSFMIGAFSNIYYLSMSKYVFDFIIFSCAFSVVYSLLSVGIIANTKNKYIGFGIPLFVYYAPYYLIGLFPDKYQNLLIWVVPFLTFDISSTDLPATLHFTQLLTILIISVLLIYIGYRRWKTAI